MAFKQTLEFEVYGEKQIRNLERLFQQLGYKIDLTYDKAKRGSETFRTASAKVVGATKDQVKAIDAAVNKLKKTSNFKPVIKQYADLENNLKNRRERIQREARKYARVINGMVMGRDPSVSGLGSTIRQNTPPRPPVDEDRFKRDLERKQAIRKRIEESKRANRELNNFRKFANRSSEIERRARFNSSGMSPNPFTTNPFGGTGYDPSVSGPPTSGGRGGGGRGGRGGGGGGSFNGNGTFYNARFNGPNNFTTNHFNNNRFGGRGGGGVGGGNTGGGAGGAGGSGGRGGSGGGGGGGFGGGRYRRYYGGYYGGHGGHSIIGTVFKVYAFDAIRRALNFVYSTTLKIGKAIYKWTLESIKFNDEMKRSQTYFTSLGLLGMKNADGTQLTIQQAKASQDKNVQTRFQKSEKVSKDFMNKLMGVSAMTGQDFNEIVSASRQGMSDLINKLSKDGKVNPYAQNPEMLNELSIRIAKMGAVLKMSDPGNRNLGYHIFPIMEALGGSNSTTGKSKGMDNAVSMRKRENIKIHEADMAYITQMVNAGKMIEAFDRLDKVMSQAGLGVEQLANMMTETLQPALDATTMFAKMFGTQLTSVLYDKARGFFKELIISLSRMSQDKRVGLSIKRISDRFAHSFDYLVLKIAGIIDRLERSPEDAEATINNIIDNFQISLQIVSDSVEGIARFMAGFLGSTDSDKSLQGVANSIHSIMLNSYKYGAKFREVANVFVDIFKVIADNAGLVATAAAALGISSVAGAAAVGAGGMATTVAATGLATAGVIAFAEAAAAIITGAAAVAAILAAIIVLGVVIKLIYEYLTRSDSNEEKAKNDARIRQETLASMTPKEREEYLKREKLANAGKGGVKPVSPTPTPTPTPTPSTKPIKTSLGAGASVAVVTPKATIDSRKSSTHTYNIASVTVIANDPKELVKQLGGKLPKTGDGAKYPASVGKGDLPDGSVG